MRKISNLVYKFNKHKTQYIDPRVVHVLTMHEYRHEVLYVKNPTY
jgi:hypothetical protein